MERIFLANVRNNGEDIIFPTREAAEGWLMSNGYVDTGEDAFEVNEDFKGTIYFWTEEGRSLDEYGDGYEPRLYVGEEPDADED